MKTVRSLIPVVAFVITQAGVCHAQLSYSGQPQPMQRATESLDGLSLKIACTNATVKLGDEIGIEFTITYTATNGASDYVYENRTYDRSGRMGEYALTVQVADGQPVPDPRAQSRGFFGGGGFTYATLKSGQSFTRVIPLNIWASIQKPGRYTVNATYRSGVRAQPITIEVLPRTEAEMDVYIAELTNQFAKTEDRFPNPRNEDVFMKLAFTGSPKIAPFMFSAMYDGGSAYWVEEAFNLYVPHSDEVKNVLLSVCLERGLFEGADYILRNYGISSASPEWRPMIEASLAEDNPNGWGPGAMASQQEGSAPFASRLIAIALGAGDMSTRMRAISALALDRTDDSVKALKTLLRDPDKNIRDSTERAIRSAYLFRGNSTGKLLYADDFDATLRTDPNNPNQRPRFGVPGPDSK